MTKISTKHAHLIYGVMQSIVLLIAGICLIAACIGIYQSGGEPIYSREKVAEAFSPIAVPVYLCLVLMVGGFLMEISCPREIKKIKAEKNDMLVLRRLHSKLDTPLPDSVLAQQRSRKLHRISTLVLLLAGSVVFLVYALNGDHFHKSQINESMIHAMYWLIPCMAVPFGYAVFTAYFCRRSIRKEIDLMKQATVGIQAGKAATAPAKDRKKLLLAVRIAVLVIGIGLLVYGYWAGGTADVETKAVNICTECVGLG